MEEKARTRVSKLLSVSIVALLLVLAFGAISVTFALTPNTPHTIENLSQGGGWESLSGTVDANTHIECAFGGYYYVFVPELYYPGNHSDGVGAIVSSPDGINWSLVTFMPAFNAVTLTTYPPGTSGGDIYPATAGNVWCNQQTGEFLFSGDFEIVGSSDEWPTGLLYWGSGFFTSGGAITWNDQLTLMNATYTAPDSRTTIIAEGAGCLCTLNVAGMIDSTGTVWLTLVGVNASASPWPLYTGIVVKDPSSINCSVLAGCSMPAVFECGAVVFPYSADCADFSWFQWHDNSMVLTFDYSYDGTPYCSILHSNASGGDFVQSNSPTSGFDCSFISLYIGQDVLFVTSGNSSNTYVNQDEYDSSDSTWYFDSAYPELSAAYAVRNGPVENATELPFVPGFAVSAIWLNNSISSSGVILEAAYNIPGTWESSTLLNDMSIDQHLTGPLTDAGSPLPWYVLSTYEQPMAWIMADASVVTVTVTVTVTQMTDDTGLLLVPLAIILILMGFAVSIIRRVRRVE